MNRIYVQKELEPDLPKIYGDQEKIWQVLVNILNNARQAMGKDGIIGIWTIYHREKENVEIIIGDTGPGIPQEIINKIFDPFFTTKGVGTGTGLGLSVSFGIIRDHGGHIEVESPSKDPKCVKAGMKTAFHIFLPVMKNHETDQLIPKSDFRF